MQKYWYAIYAYPGYEHRVKAALTRKIRDNKMEDAFGEILVPSEKVVELVRGVKHIVERRIFPGYVLVQVGLTDEVWHLIRSIPKVIGFVGRNKFPTALSDAEVQEIINKAGVAAVRPRPKPFSSWVTKLRSLMDRSGNSPAPYRNSIRNARV